MNLKDKYTPPYIYEGWEADQRRKAEALEAEQRAEDQRRADEWLNKQREMHAQGMHMPGFCPECPPNVFYD